MEIRILIKILQELAVELGFTMQTFSNEWIIRFEKGTLVKHIIAYDWELNSSTAQMIAKDKNACAELLSFNKVPNIEHKLFQNPRNKEYLPEIGNWSTMIDFLKEHNNKIVAKPNSGTGGQQVILISNQIELENAVQGLFVTNRNLALCPYYNYENEYRVIIQQNEVELIYKKIRPFVIGNGTTSLSGLILEKYEKIDFGKFDLLDNTTLDKVIPTGERILLAWKHNLGKGAFADIVTDTKGAKAVTDLALAAAKVIHIDFASVDIAECDDGLRVVEINSGVMMEKFAQQSDKHYNISKGIYRNALKILGF